MKEHKSNPNNAVPTLPEAADRADMSALLERAVAALPPRERQVLVLHYGLKDGQPRSLAEIGAMLGVSRERTDRIEALLREKNCPVSSGQPETADRDLDARQALPLFDTHAHYDHPLFAGHGPDIVARLFSQGVVNGVVIPAISYKSNFDRDMFPESRFPRVYFAAGLHPKHAVNEPWWTTSTMDEFNAVVDDRRTVAIKTGLDFSKAKLTPAQRAHQERFFQLLTALANLKKLPLVLHVRDAADRLPTLLSEAPLGVEAAVHCFTGSYETAQRLLDAGVTRFGIGGMLTRNDMATLRSCVKALPLTTILLETDAPFVRPENYEGLNTSETLMSTLGLIAELKALPVRAVAEAVQKNAVDFYGLPFTEE